MSGRARSLGSTLMVCGAAAAASLVVWPAVSSAAPLRILYSSDWTGTRQIYSADVARPDSVAQLTFGRPAGCDAGRACGYVDVSPSPDGASIALWSTVSGKCEQRLFVARSDGRGLRAIRLGLAPCASNVAVWSPDSRRLAYLGRDGLHVVGRDGSHDRIVYRGQVADRGLSWSPDGRRLAFRLPNKFVYRDGYQLVVVRLADGDLTVPVTDGFDPVLSPDGRRVAYRSVAHASPGDTVRVVDASGLHDRSLGVQGSPSWSASGRWIGVSRYSDKGLAMTIIDTATGRRRVFGSPRSSDGPLWAPRGSLFAYRENDSIWIGDARTGRTRQLAAVPVTPGSMRWAPSADAIGYLSNEASYWGGGDLRLVTLAGRDQVLVRANGRYGGSLFRSAFALVRPRAGARFRLPSGRSIATASADAVTAQWPVTELAADGNRVAYVSCGHVFVWTPAAKTVDQVDAIASAVPWCSTPGDYVTYLVYSIALAGERVAYAWKSGNMGRIWAVTTTAAQAERPSFELERQVGAAGGISSVGLGDLVGAGNLLVYSRWREQRGSGVPVPTPVIEQTVARIDGDACPCPWLASEKGPYTPFDVAESRILAGGTNELRLLDRSGKTTLSIGISAAAAALNGNDVAVLVRGSLRHYDATTGELRHSWPLADAPSGYRCGTPSGYRCPEVRLVLDDLAQGLAVYVNEGHVHLLRLADGADRILAAGSRARFMNTGVVYADRERIRHVPFGELPLRAFAAGRR